MTNRVVRQQPEGAASSRAEHRDVRRIVRDWHDAILRFQKTASGSEERHGAAGEVVRYRLEFEAAIARPQGTEDWAITGWALMPLADEVAWHAMTIGAGYPVTLCGWRFGGPGPADVAYSRPTDGALLCPICDAGDLG